MRSFYLNITLLLQYLINFIIINVHYLNKHYIFYLTKYLPTSFWYLISFIFGIYWHLLFNNSYLALTIIIIYIVIASITFIYYISNQNTKYILHNFIYKYALISILFITGVLRIYIKDISYQSFLKACKGKKNYSAYIMDIDKVNNKDMYIFYLNELKRYIKVYIKPRSKGKNKINIFKLADNISISNIFINNFNNKDIKNICLKQNIYAISFPKGLNYKIIKSNNSLYKKLYLYRQNLLNKFKSKFSSITYNLYSLIFLGKANKDNNIKHIKDSFTKWGIIHYLARSGLHIMLVISLINLSLKLIPINFLIKHIVIIITIIIYAILSWPTVSFMRSFLFYLLYFLTVIKNKPVYYLHIFNLVSFIVLLYNPYYLFALDFQLSFSITWALLWFSEIKRRQKIDSNF